MKTKRAVVGVLSVILAAVLMLVGLYRVVQVYKSYRSDILIYESRHLDSIVSTSARGMGWMMDRYLAQLRQFVDHERTERAEEEFRTTGQALVPSARQLFDQPTSVAVYDDTTGELLASSYADHPVSVGEDETLGADLCLRQNEGGEYWLVFTELSEARFRYEAAIRFESLFDIHAAVTHVGRHGYLFLLDRETRLLAYSGNGDSGVLTAPELQEDAQSGIRMEALRELASRGPRTPEDYAVYRFPFSAYPEGSDEALVVTAPLMGSGTGLVMGAAVSFQEFNAFLNHFLQEMVWVIVLELGGALILLLIAASIIVYSRRNAMELAAVRERADLMEEINRQQQSLAHGERLQQLGVMTSGIVHEFNNLLTPIMGQCLLLLEQLADDEESPQFESALEIYEASENARDTLRRMSNLGKKDVDQSFHLLDLSTLLKKTMNLVSMAKDSHITQKILLPPEPLFVEGSDELLTQAFLNICINACQAMGTEGTLSMEAEQEVRSGRAYAVVRVSDTGPGIPEEKMSSIYEPFYTTKGERGTGLGLAICQKIIETHKGTIRAENRPDGGAMFTVRIPVCELPEQE